MERRRKEKRRKIKGNKEIGVMLGKLERYMYGELSKTEKL